MATRSRSRTARFEAISVPIGPPLQGRIKSWEKHAADRDVPRFKALKFADWIDELRNAWVAAAVEEGWEASNRSAYAPDGCRQLEGLVCHVQTTGGLVLHLIVERDGRSTKLSAKRCHQGIADADLVHTWTDDDRLTADEIAAGSPCRGCGRGFMGGPPFVAIMHRTPQQQADAEAEETTFKGLHPDCHSSRWSIAGGGITHCARCCAPPPPPQAAIDLVARILIDAGRADAELAQRWNTRTKPKATSTSSAPLSNPRLDRLAKEAGALGYRLVPTRSGDADS